MTLPRFSLRLLLVAVAVICVWLAWERSVVMERRATREALENDGVVFQAYEGVEDPFAGPFVRPERAGPPSVSWIRMQLGDVPIDWIMVPLDFATDDAIARRFPEAKIWRDDLPASDPLPVGDPLATP